MIEFQKLLLQHVHHVATPPSEGVPAKQANKQTRQTPKRKQHIRGGTNIATLKSKYNINVKTPFLLNTVKSLLISWLYLNFLFATVGSKVHY